MEPKYPFVPKSTANLRAGQLISVPLSNGKFACGRVLQLKIENGNLDRVTFLVGLMDWTGSESPKCETIAGSKIIEHGQVHIKTVRECCAEIVGFRALEEDGLELPLSLDEQPGENCHLRQGFNIIGKASEEQQKTLNVFSTWGYQILKIKAEQNFV